jgi:hypothetical protein
MRDYSNDLPGSGDAEFRRWLTDNPDGFFAHVIGAGRAMLHRWHCPHMKFGPGDASNLVNVSNGRLTIDES